MSDYSVCPFCGKQAYVPRFPPHGDDPCPLKVEEHKARLAAIERSEHPVAHATSLVPDLLADIARRAKRQPGRTR